MAVGSLYLHWGQLLEIAILQQFLSNQVRRSWDRKEPWKLTKCQWVCGDRSKTLQWTCERSVYPNVYIHGKGKGDHVASDFLIHGAHAVRYCPYLWGSRALVVEASIKSGYKTETDNCHRTDRGRCHIQEWVWHGEQRGRVTDSFVQEVAWAWSWITWICTCHVLPTFHRW